MSKWIQWTAPAAVAMSADSSAYAVEYMTIPEAQKQAFPSASFAEIQAGRIWKAESAGRLLGFFIFDRVIGKHLYIDYVVALDPGGRIRNVELLQYRESYGGGAAQACVEGAFAGQA